MVEGYILNPYPVHVTAHMFNAISYYYLGAQKIRPVRIFNRMDYYMNGFDVFIWNLTRVLLFCYLAKRLMVACTFMASKNVQTLFRPNDSIFIWYYKA